MEGGHEEMRKKAQILAILAVLLLFPHLSLADCVDLGNYTGWYLEDAHTIIFYVGRIPLATLTISDCQIRQSSYVLLITNYVCNSDSILVDGQKCRIMTVKTMD
jgi:hypothetical protein